MPKPYWGFNLKKEKKVNTDSQYYTERSTVRIALVPNISNALVVEIPASSPLHKLQFLKKGWDGFHADPLSPQTLSTAQEFWSTLERSIKGCPEWLPTVEAGAGDFVEFAWSQNNKELRIWLYGEPDLRAEWFSSEAEPNEGEAYTLSELIGIVREYLFGRKDFKNCYVCNKLITGEGKMITDSLYYRNWLGPFLLKRQSINVCGSCVVPNKGAFL